MFAAPALDYQNGTNWQIELCQRNGTRLKIIDTAGPFQIIRVVNNVGSFSLRLPANFDNTLIGIDRRIVFWRRPASGSMYVEFEGRVKKIITSADEYGNITRSIAGPSLEYYLQSRVVPWPAGYSTSTVTATADNLLKRIAAGNLGTTAAPFRQLDTSVFGVQSYSSSAPTITKSYGYRNVLDVMREITDAARAYGTETYFNIFSMPPTFEFRTTINQPGSDRTQPGNGLIFGMVRNNLKKPILTEDYTNEYNFVYAQDSDQTITTAATTRGLYPDSLREVTVRGKQADAWAKLSASRPSRKFTCELQSVEGSVYGLDWNFGDRVTIDFDGRQFSALVRSVTISVSETGAETVSGFVEAYL